MLTGGLRGEAGAAPPAPAARAASDEEAHRARIPRHRRAPTAAAPQRKPRTRTRAWKPRPAAAGPGAAPLMPRTLEA